MRILFVIALLIGYGSLYPGDFLTPEAGAVKKFLTDWRLFTSLGDLLGNIALFFPLGMAGILFALDRPNARIRITWFLLLTFFYSFALQLAQVWLPSRSAALADVIWNMAGMISGMSIAYLVGGHSSERMPTFSWDSLVPLSILVLWLLTELLPLVPSLDLQKFKDALKPLLLGFSFSFPAAIMHAAGVIVAGSTFIALGWSALWLAAALMLVWAGKIAIVNLTLDASLLIGTLAGYSAYLTMLRLGGTKFFKAAFWLLLAAWTISAITPFSPAQGGTFNGIPFATMLQGSMETGVKGFTQSLFIYTAMLWLVHKTNAGMGKAAVCLAIWSCLIELIQMGLLGRTADVTEPILLLLVGWVLSVAKNLEISPRQEIRTGVPQPEPHPIGLIRMEMSGKRVFGSIAIGIAICVAVGWLITQSPLTPYNIRELVYEGHPLRSLVLLAILLYWAIGFPVLIAQWLARGELYLLSFPPLALLHGLIAWLLLWSSVPSEAIHDIVGYPVLAWSWEWEVLGRLLALFSLWSVAATFGALSAAWRILPDARSALLGWTIGACLLIPFSYYIVVIVASTDNLVELIASNGGVGSFLLIGVAMAGISFGGTKGALALIRDGGRLIGAIPWVVGAGILAYLALYVGMEQVIIKYGQVFSALQFLLSSDRSHLAGPDELIVRYTMVYFFLIAAIVMVQYPLWYWMMSASGQPNTDVSEGLPTSANK
jgi:hypothetical protein